MHREQKDKNFILMYAGSSRLMRNFVSSLLQASGYVLYCLMRLLVSRASRSDRRSRCGIVVEFRSVWYLLTTSLELQ